MGLNPHLIWAWAWEWTWAFYSPLSPPFLPSPLKTTAKSPVPPPSSMAVHHRRRPSTAGDGHPPPSFLKRPPCKHKVYAFGLFASAGESLECIFHLGDFFRPSTSPSSAPPPTLSVFGRMLKLKCSPDMVTFKTFLHGLCMKAETMDAAVEFFNRLGRNGCPADVVTITILIKGLCRTGRVSIAVL